jgi:LETM1 and EF-hand domain-containing protein 1
MAMSLASLSRPGYRFKPATQNLFLLESVSYALPSRRLGSTSSEGRTSSKPDDVLPSGKPGSTSGKGSALFSPAPSKPASSASASPTKSADKINEASAPLETKPAVAEDKSAVKSKDDTKPEGRIARSWAWVKHEANHYWDGSKLLAAEVRVSSKLLRKVLNGARLTRRERRQASRFNTSSQN